MKLLTQKTDIYTFKTLRACFESLDLNTNDLILTSKRLYQHHLEPLDVKGKVLFHDTYGKGEPSDLKINKLLKDAKLNTFNRVIAIGGGTVMDIAKLFVLKDLVDCTDAFERTIDFAKEKELICIPTTCGTGSEVTNLTIAEITSKSTKMGLGDPSLLPDQAFLVPELLIDLPYHVFMHSSIDALIHATESFLSPKATLMTELYSLKAIEIILKLYNDMSMKGKEERSKHLLEVLLASTYAGIAFGNAGVGAVHALSYPLGGTYHVPHGEANFQFFVPVLKTYNLKNPSDKMKDLKQYFATLLNCLEEDALDVLEELLKTLIEKPLLRTYGMTEDDVKSFPSTVLQTQQRLLANNFADLTEEDIHTIYSDLF